MTEAGYPVQQVGQRMELSVVSRRERQHHLQHSESNKSTAEFAQAQWKQNLGYHRSDQEHGVQDVLAAAEQGRLRRASAAADGSVTTWIRTRSFTFSTRRNNTGATGWWDPKYDRMLDEANNTINEQKRYEKLAAAELYMMQKQIVIPLGVPGTSWLKKPYVKGLYPNPGTLHPWKFVYIERDSAKWDKNVDNLMSEKDPVVEEQVAAIVKTQEEFVKSKQTATRSVPVE